MDQLSDLPDALLHQIYSWMPTEEVVRTSVLSKRWNGLWISSPSLSFNEYLHERLEDFYEFVNRTLIFRGCSKVKSFRIRLCVNLSYTLDLDLWIRYALQNEAEELLLDLSADVDFYAPPQLLYFSSSLTSLRLSMCTIRPIKGVSWTSLKTLVLEFVILMGNIIHKVSVGCPQLESLELFHCVCYNVLRIYSTSLKRLVIADSRSTLTEFMSKADLEISAPHVEYICMSGDLYRKCLLTNLSSLLQATLYFKTFTDGTSFSDEQVRFLEVLESVEHVENLKLGEWCIKVLSIREKFGLPCRPLKCKSLVLNTRLAQEDIPGILLLLKCSPDLETLTMDIVSEHIRHGSKVDFCSFAGDRYINSGVDGISCLQLKLRTVNITHFVEQNLVIPWIKFMLREARVLKNMEIRFKYLGPNSTTDSLFNVARELSEMPKSSPNVVVKLHNSDRKITVTIS